ncbi:MAG: C4-type zinc ribbon domain-containing protein [Acidimicrobiales bacterium]
MATKAQEALLLVQEADTAADQLRHRRVALAQREAVAAGEAEAVEAKRAHDALVELVAELAARQAELEDGLGVTEARADAVETRLRSGESTAARDILRWGEEVEHLRQRASSLEDQAFQALVEREAADAELAGAAERLAAAVASVRRLRGQLARAEEDLDTELGRIEAERTDAAGGVPDDLLARYDRLRAHLGGIGAARLEDGRCTGCHLALSPRDLDEARRAPPDAELACESCGRILVRA